MVTDLSIRYERKLREDLIHTPCFIKRNSEAQGEGGIVLRSL